MGAQLSTLLSVRPDVLPAVRERVFGWCRYLRADRIMRPPVCGRSSDNWRLSCSQLIERGCKTSKGAESEIASDAEAKLVQWCPTGIAVGLFGPSLGARIAAIQGVLTKFLQDWMYLRVFFLVCFQKGTALPYHGSNLRRTRLL